MIWAILAFVLLAVPALYRGWLGWRDGATTEMRHLIVIVFSVLLALRFWEPGTRIILNLVAADPRWIALFVFSLLAVVGATFASLAVRLQGYAFHQAKANVVDQVLGVIVGLAGGTLVGGTLAMLMVLALPNRYGADDTPEVALRPGSLPLEFCRQVEELIEIDSRGPNGTRFPTVGFREEAVDASDDAPEAEPGMRMVRMTPVLVWR
ncbi:MAG: CvpA family protein [Chthoniobacterales bacterium]